MRIDETFTHDGKLVEQTVDNGDGTGTRTDYTTDPPTVTQLTGLPIPTLPDDLLLTAVDPRDTTTIRRT